MLTVHRISKSYGLETILEGISFNLNPGERLGLVGPNGCGKTTLLRIIAGLEDPDSGGMHFDPPDLRLGYLPQGLNISAAIDVVTIQSYLAQYQEDIHTLTLQLEQLATDLAKNPEQAELQQEYEIVLSRLQMGSQYGQRTPEVLSALNLEHFPTDTPVSNLSGGQKTRLALAGVLLSDPQLLLLDEPTNHLDLEMLSWLEKWLLNFRGGVLLVSHDRALLDRTATAILELDPRTHTVHHYVGNYTDYLETRVAERERQWQAYRNQQDEISRLRRAAARVRGNAKLKRGGKGDSGDKFAKGYYSDQTQGTIARAKHLERRLERLLSDDRIEKPKDSWQMKLDFGETPSSGRAVLSLDDLSIGYTSSPLVEDINLHLWYGGRVALIGPNGSGKTTLLRSITGVISPLSGSVRMGSNVRIGYMTQEGEDLDRDLDAFSTIRALAPLSETDARAFLHQYLFSGDDVFIPVSQLSYGERSRLSLACLVARGCNLLLLDEPINHLDIPSRARFESALSSFEGTIIAVVHDRFFIEGFADQIWEISQVSDSKNAPHQLKAWIV
ncbi:MAG: ABC-F family ATP-binding cassette domain-containing protein [Anaerolineales bacterium]|jgi:ATP-binding cassette subfamily F protein 3